MEKNFSQKVEITIWKKAIPFSYVCDDKEKAKRIIAKLLSEKETFSKDKFCNNNNNYIFYNYENGKLIAKMYFTSKKHYFVKIK